MTNYKQFYLSLAGKRRYQREKAELEQELAKLSEEIKLMRHYNETKANVAWEEAQRQSNFLAMRLDAVDTILSRSRVLYRRHSREVKLGSTVKVRNGHGEYRFKIVDPVEANPAEGLISYASPVGTALVGRRLNEEVAVVSPVGKRLSYQVLAIS